ncbi:MAG: S8 family serine peptidase, partial [bacterium]
AKTSMAAPACSPSAVSVGAVYDSNMGAIGWSGCSDSSTAADKVTCFSNSTSFLDLLAPGALITAGGHTMGGTSQASPHVAGAMALVAAAFPDATPDEIEARLKSTGVNVTDSRNSV